MFQLEKLKEESECLVKFTYLSEDMFTVFAHNKCQIENEVWGRFVRFDFTEIAKQKIRRLDKFLDENFGDTFCQDLLLNHENRSFVTFEKIINPDSAIDNINEFVRIELNRLNNIIEKAVNERNEKAFEKIFYNRFYYNQLYYNEIFNTKDKVLEVEKLNRKADKFYYEFRASNDNESELNYLKSQMKYNIENKKLELNKVEKELSQLISANEQHTIYYAFLEKKRYEFQKEVDSIKVLSN